MTKQEQIEEMARVACEHFDYDMVDQPCAKCKTHDKHCYTIHQAEILYNAGYRKIDDDCAVITKDELKEYKRQAVKEFAEKLKSGLGNCTGCYIPDCFESPTDKFAYSEKDLLKLIYELLKEYEKCGVEKKE